MDEEVKTRESSPDFCFTKVHNWRIIPFNKHFSISIQRLIPERGAGEPIEAANWLHGVNPITCIASKGRALSSPNPTANLVSVLRENRDPAIYS
ncbi:hypothetical protein FHS14_001905 [Paenibacillus baekrokdamisoli]|nr:hypothetical protein [Paenibacillus baekrokdamisoli]